MKKTFIYLSFIIFLGWFPSLFAGEIYVSLQGNDKNPGTKEAPFYTLNRAIKQAREWRRLNRPEVAGGIYIRLEEGVYAQRNSLFLRPEDSGTPDSPTVICAVDGAHPVISGGVAVTGWKRGCNHPAIPEKLRQKIWSAEAPLIGNRRVETRQMWVNGHKVQRAAQFPDGGLEQMIDFNPEEQTITIPVSQNVNPKRLQNAGQLEMIVHQRWAIAILRVKSIDAKDGQAVVRFHEPESHLEFAHPWPQPVIGGEKGNSSFCLTNALELLDQPGEWFQEYPSGTIYYYPQAGENMETAEVIIPALETLVTIDGTLSRPVKHIQFNGITFAHTSWMRPSFQGHVTLQGGFPLLDAYKLQEPGLPEKAELENQAWIIRPETAIRVRGAEHIDFKHCTFRHLSSTGLDYEWAVTASSVEDCQFTDIGGTALLVGAFPDGGFETHVPFIPADVRELCSHITIRNNFISNVTNEDWGCVGIGAGYVRNMDISHNEVCHLNYSGICVGWGWTSLESGMCNNRIEANYVHHFARRLYDAGGLYTLSNQPGSVMRNNRIEHLIEAPYATNDRVFISIWMKLRTDIQWKTTGVPLNVLIRTAPGKRTCGRITGLKWRIVLSTKPEE